MNPQDMNGTVNVNLISMNILCHHTISRTSL